MNRFEGIGRLYGDGAAKLAKARVLVVGLGGVGSWTVEALARSGVGALTVMDGDDVCLSNVNRQLHALDETVGRSKASVMAERVTKIHPGCKVTAIEGFYSRSDKERPFGEPLDYVVDCVDGVTAKGTLIGTAHRLGIPVITCGAAGGKVDPSRVQVTDLVDAHHDRLLMFVRKNLRKHHGFPDRKRKKFGVPCVFSDEPVRVLCEPDPEEETAEGGMPFPESDTRLNCEGRLGSAVFVTAVFGFHAAARVVRDLVNGRG